MSKNPRLILLGGGGHARVVIEILQLTRKYEIAGVLSQRDSPPSIDGVPVIGDDEQIARMRADDVQYFFVAVGSIAPGPLRKRLFEMAVEHGLQPAFAIHPRAVVSPSARLQPGSAVFPGAIVNAGVSVGSNAIINSGAVIEHDCTLGDHVHVATAACLCGGVSVGEGAHIGAGAVVRQNVSIGPGALIAAGAVVVSDVSASAIVMGVPARRSSARLEGAKC